MFSFFSFEVNVILCNYKKIGIFLPPQNERFLPQAEEPPWSQLQLPYLRLAFERHEEGHAEGLNYLSSLNEVGKVGVGKPKPREVKWLIQGHTAHSSGKAQAPAYPQATATSKPVDLHQNWSLPGRHLQTGAGPGGPGYSQTGPPTSPDRRSLARPWSSAQPWSVQEQRLF